MKIKDRRDIVEICVLNTIGAVECVLLDKRDGSRSNLEKSIFDFRYLNSIQAVGRGQPTRRGFDSVSSSEVLRAIMFYRHCIGKLRKRNI